MLSLDSSPLSECRPRNLVPGFDGTETSCKIGQSDHAAQAVVIEPGGRGLTKKRKKAALVARS
jgi:hypothetical protein